MIIQRFNKIKNRIKLCQEKNCQLNREVQLLAVSKTWPADTLRDLFHAGQQCFGENYLQEAIAKMAMLEDLDIIWHFIGHIQANKTKIIAAHFDWVQSIDRLKIAKRLSRQRPSDLSDLNICIQINMDNETDKSGIAAADLMPFAQQINQIERLTLRGIMIVSAKINNPTQQRRAFGKARQLFDKLTTICPTVDTLSMGMSHDMETAIVEGSTMVRLGTMLFGKRAML